MKRLIHPIVLLAALAGAGAAPPNILVIVGDDLGFNDVSFRGSNQIPTPNIDALAYSGVILDRHYVLPTCTPSRTALLTGQYPIRTGMQGYPLMAGERRALPLDFPTLPQRLAELGYQTNLVGKWHLGFYKSEFTPTQRGFQHHLGYWNGYMSYFNHDIFMTVSDAHAKNRVGLDMHWDHEPAWELRGRYATHVFTQRAEEIIANHDPTAGPLYLQIAHLAPHAGLNGTELEVPDEEGNDRRHAYIQDHKRKRLAGVIRELDQSVGQVVRALQDKGMLNNTIIVFMADNGGETQGQHKNSGSNWPLRGQKFTVYEGGVRGAAAVWSPLLAKPGTIHKDLIHMTDWMPTLYEAAGGDVSDLGQIDGLSQWKALAGHTQEPVRSEVLVQIDQAGAIIQDNWKLIQGELFPENCIYLGESGRGTEVPAYDPGAVVTSPVAKTLAAASTRSRRLTASAVLNLRAQATLPATCRPVSSSVDVKCQPYCLFDIRDDPCESKDVSAVYPGVAKRLLNRLRHWEALTVPQLNTDVDPASDPLRHNMTWVPWMDGISTATPASAPAAPALFAVAIMHQLYRLIHR